jgi:mRNA interferase RelE/StbE
MAYRVELAPSARRELARLDRTMQRRIGDALDALQDQPRPAGVTKLAGLENTWRIRVGTCRVVYQIHADRLVVLVVRIAHRKDVYRGGS